MRMEIDENVLEPCNEYEVLGVIGSGAFGTIYKVRSVSTGEVYALKKVMLKGLSVTQQRNALKEVLILGKVCHPNIVKYITSYLEESALNLVMEFIPGGDLFQVLQS
jgi:NIMA (never in mitosis gene a)-related kinase